LSVGERLDSVVVKLYDAILLSRGKGVRARVPYLGENPCVLDEWFSPIFMCARWESVLEQCLGEWLLWNDSCIELSVSFASASRVVNQVLLKTALFDSQS